MILNSITPKQKNYFEKFYRIFFYILCFLVLVSATIKLGGVLDKRIGIGELKIRMDHFLHAIAYFIFSLYYIAGVYLGLKLFRRRSHIFYFILIVFLGLLAEGLQIWIPYRSFSLMDLLSNLFGIVIGYIITIISLRQERKLV